MKPLQHLLLAASPSYSRVNFIQNSILSTCVTQRWSSINIQGRNIKESQSILYVPTGCLTDDAWNKGLQALKESSNKQTLQGSEESWALLDRLVDEEEARRTKNPSYESILTASILSSVIHSWCSLHGILTADDVLKKINNYQIKVPDLYPCNRCYSMILDAAIKRGEENAYKMGEDILRTLMDNRHQNPYARPNVVMFNTAMNALAKSGTPDAHLRAEALLLEMKTLTADGWTDMRPNPITFACVMAAWGESRHPDAPQRAEELLEELGNPDERVYNALLNVWVKSNSPIAADRCFQIFRHMQMLAKVNNSTIRVQGYTYSNVIAAFAKRGRAQEAEKVLQELIKEYTATQDPGLRPNRIHFTSLIDAHVKSSTRGYAFKAEEILYRMEEVAKDTNNTDLLPSSATYTTVLNAWAKSREIGAVERAEALIQRMMERYESGDDLVKPNIRCYTMLLHCYAKSRSKISAMKAEETLQMLHNKFKGGHKELKPHVQAYANVLDAWSNSGAVEAPDRVEALLVEMERKASEDGFDTFPNEFCYTAAISTWARSGRADAVSHAETLMKKINDYVMKGSGGRKQVASSIHAYGALLDCHSRFNRPQDADIILQKLCSNYLKGKSLLQPNGVCFRIVISAWSRSNHIDAPSNADAIFDRMIQFGLNGDTHIYNLLIVLWAKVNDINSSQKAEAYFNQMTVIYEGGDSGCKPDMVTYTNVLSAVFRSKDPNHITRAREILDKMKACDVDCQPTQFIYHNFLFCIARSNQHDKANMALHVLTEMEEQGIKVDVRTFNAVLEACALSSQFHRNDRDTAFQVAIKVYERAKTEKMYNEFTFGQFFSSAAGLQKDNEVEQAFRLCCTLGFQYNRKILKILQKYFPNLFLSLFQ